MVRLTDRPAMTTAVNVGRKATKPKNNIFLKSKKKYMPTVQFA